MSGQACHIAFPSWRRQQNRFCEGQTGDAANPFCRRGIRTILIDVAPFAAAVRVAMEFFAGRAATGFAIPEWLPIPDNVQYNRAVSDLETIVYNIIAKRRAHRDDQEAPKVLSTLSQSHCK